MLLILWKGSVGKYEIYGVLVVVMVSFQTFLMTQIPGDFVLYTEIPWLNQFCTIDLKVPYGSSVNVKRAKKFCTKSLILYARMLRFGNIRP